MKNQKKRRQAVKSRMRKVDSFVNAARKAIDRGDLNTADRASRSAIKLDPLVAEPYHILAHIAYTQGRLQSAGDHILEAATRDDENLDIHADCGAIMNTLGRGTEAEAACRHVIELDPRHLQARNNLSVALDLQGRFKEALEEVNEVISELPTYVDAIINKGSILVKIGEPVKAIEVLTNGVNLAPENPLLRVNLATALRHVGEFDTAREQVEIAIGLNTEYPEAYGVLGDIFAATGEYEASISAYDTALIHRPGFKAVQLNRAAALFKVGNLDDSEDAYTNLLNNFDSAECYAGLGTIQLARGCLNTATQSFRKAVEIDPSNASAWAALASSPHMEIVKSDIEIIKKSCFNPNVTQEKRIAAHFAIGEFFDKNDQYEEAFFHFKAGNDEKKIMLAAKDLVFDFDVLMKDIRATIQQFDKKTNLNTDINADERLVFIIGMPRSGTSLVEQILASHSDIVGLGEAMSVMRLQPNSATKVSAKNIITKLIRLAPDARRIIDKTPFHFHKVGLIRHLFPNSYIIHCQRDLLDTGVSCYMQNFINEYSWSYDLEHIGLYIRAYKELMSHWRLIFGETLIEINYEQLVCDPEPNIRHLVEQVNLEWDPSCLNFYNTQRPVFTASSWQVRQPIYESKINRASKYTQYLSPLIENLV